MNDVLVIVGWIVWIAPRTFCRTVGKDVIANMLRRNEQLRMAKFPMM